LSYKKLELNSREEGGKKVGERNVFGELALSFSPRLPDF
jgi:hypothetical protein